MPAKRPSATWKGWERFWGLKLGGRRVPVTGRIRGDAPDVECPTFAVEVKYGRVMSARMQMAVKQAEACAKKSGKVPLVCITQTVAGHRPRHFVLLALMDFQDLANIEQESGIEEPEVG